MRNKAKNIRMNLEVSLDVETLSCLRFSLTVHIEIKKKKTKHIKKERNLQSAVSNI